MIIKKHIADTLDYLDRKYNASLLSPDSHESIYYSKLAILEYCGWIEDVFDMIVRRSVKNRLKTLPFRQMLETSIIGNNHGFQYKDNIRPMLTRAIGIKEMEKIEIHLDRSGYLPILISQLNDVKKDRDSAAHTWKNNVMRTYPSPSITKSRLDTVYPITREMYSLVIKL